MVDLRSGRCRGFGFVDFTDEASFKLAMTFANFGNPEGILLDHSANGRFKVEAAKPPQAAAPAPQTSSLQQELLSLREQTEGMERARSLQEARVRELTRELNAMRARQLELESQRAVDERLALERQLQEDVQRDTDRLRLQEESLNEALRLEDLRIRALESLVAETNTKQAEAAEEVPPPSSEGERPTKQAEEFEASPQEPERPRSCVIVRNTFIDLVDEPPVKPLYRTCTAPPKYQDDYQGPAANQEGSPTEQTPPVPASEPHRDLPYPEDPPEAEPEGFGESGLADDSAPWSPHESRLLRALLQEKMKDFGSGEAYCNSANHFSQRPQNSEPDPEEPALEHGRVVRLRNLPTMPLDKLEAQLLGELERLWRQTRGSSNVEIDSIEYQVLTSSVEAFVSFSKEKDAFWLVDRRLPENWSSPKTLSITGRVLQAEWPKAAQVDWRKLGYVADADASSGLSYNTDGSSRSYSSQVAMSTKSVPNTDNVRNRTIVLSGIDRSLQLQTVKMEVLSLLQRLWQQDGYRFDPENQLHQGSKGIKVRSGQPGCGNDGTCLIRFRRYADCKWLVEQAKDLKLDGRMLRASWGKPRRKRM